MAKLVSKIYGEALFERVVEDGIVDAMYEEVSLVRQALLENEAFLKLLNHPKIDNNEKVKIIENTFKGRVSDDLCGLLVIMVQKGRYNDFIPTFDYFMDLVKEYQKIGVVFVTSAVELKQEQKERLEKRLLETTQYRSFEMHYHVDESLIGGMKIRIGDRVVDSSIQTKLEHMSRSLLNVQV
ncbi:MAG: ATP synthase F1 subunit delta [Clostridiales bacterium]|nr:ATP synthase F1 subunit delta [Clostridiales bacterium]